MSNEPYFVGKDAAEKLEYLRPSDAIADHVEEDDTSNYSIRSKYTY
ncbi:Bro-N domain-containing protein [Clostridium cadaveris]